MKKNKPIYLNKNVTNKMLKDVGFVLMHNNGKTTAYRNRSGHDEKEVIIVQNGDKRELKWRYQSQEGEPLIDEIGDILFFFDIEEGTQDISVNGLNELSKEIHKNAVAHGWWDSERSFGEIIALIHSEASEALEEYRNRKSLYYKGEDGKPEGIAVEMIDVIIRVLDYLGKKEVDVEKILKEKHEYNKKRPYKHGNKAV